ncbi:MAG: acyltransferase [Bacteroidota bacterium]|nr:acyltransferase [Bacteroidota bacterium]
MTLFEFIFRLLRRIKIEIISIINRMYTYFILKGNGINFKNFKSNGVPFVAVSKNGNFEIGIDFKMNNGLIGNPIGRPQPCTFVVDSNAHLKIGNNVGISSTAIVCHLSIQIGDNVKIGGGTCIYDTDFHALDKKKRMNSKTDMLNKADKPVIIGNNVFIGAHSTILKGVIIGENSIIGACSVVSKSIPSNEIWAGNPIKFIKKL